MKALGSLIALIAAISPVGADLISELSGISGGFRFTYPGQSDYATAIAPFNQRYAYQPAAVAFVNSVKQVSQVVKIGSDLGYHIVTRSGGPADIMDTYSLQTLWTYEDGAKADVTPGFKLGTVAYDFWSQRRALPHGTCPYVGWGGHVAHGGFGATSRLWGLTLDKVISAEIVLANGTIATASKDVNPDLFFAIRGAGSSFGVVTKHTVATLPAPNSTTVFQYGWNLNIQDGCAAFQSFQSFSMLDTTPAELGIQLVLAKGSSRGTITFMVTGVWYGPANGFDAALKPLLDILPKPSWNNKNVGDYLNSLIQLGEGSISVTAPEPKDTFYAKSLITPESKPLNAEAQKPFITYLAQNGFDAKVDWWIEVGLIGGKNSAVNKVPASETAFPHRSGLHLFQFYASTTNLAPPYPSSGFTLVDGLYDSIVKNMPANWDYGAYTNYIDDRLPNAAQLYYKQNLPRLQELKAKYDPKGVFNAPGGVVVTP
ncbi:hypothetical protein NMY22_g1087 [Coprinellus aureogranulatus]|nr:hypothetical protein NMY22_g1087 [Coprinellus aureogranulatus]